MKSVLTVQSFGPGAYSDGQARLELEPEETPRRANTEYSQLDVMSDHALFSNISSRKAIAQLREKRTAGSLIITPTKKDPDFVAVSCIAADGIYKYYFHKNGQTAALNGKAPSWKNFESFKTVLEESLQEAVKNKRNATSKSGPSTLAKQELMNSVDEGKLERKLGKHNRIATMNVVHGMRAAMEKAGEKEYQCVIYDRGDATTRTVFFSKSSEKPGEIDVKHVYVDLEGYCVGKVDGVTVPRQDIAAFLDQQWPDRK